MSAPTLSADRIRPAAPAPHDRALTPLQVIREMGRNPIAAFGIHAYSERYIYSRNWVQDFMLVSDPDGIKYVLLDNVANYRKSIQFQRLTRPALGNGLVNAEGASWRFQRRTAAPMFQPRHIADFAGVMREAAEAMLERWSQLPDGAEIDAADEMMQLTYAIISRTLFSNDVTMQYGKMAEALAVYLETQGKVSVARTLGVPNWFPTPDNLRARGPLKYFRKELMGLIARRRAQLAANPESARHDFLDLLLTTRDPEGGALFGEAEVFDNVLTFVFAGHETTSNALAWTLYLLSLHPDAETRAAAEAKTNADLTYTRMVLEEAMRLYPPAPIIARVTTRPFTLANRVVPVGSMIYVPIYALHRHSALWDRPEEFDPERFAPAPSKARHRYAYMPFGGGPRVCIGGGFAMLEGVAILATLLRGAKLTSVDPQPPKPRMRLTLRPGTPLMMRVEPRG